MLDRYAILIATLAGLVPVLAGSAEPGVKSYDDVMRDTEYVMELIAKRQLTRAEIERATHEFLEAFDDHCDSKCVDIVQENIDRVEPMRTNPGEPTDLLARQYYSRVLHFSPTQAGSFIQKLTNEADPIRVTDSKVKRVMTEGDVHAVMNINRFIEKGGQPVDHPFSKASLEDVAARWQERISEDAWRLSFRAGLALELWTGIRKNWDRLDADQQQQIRLYFSDDSGSATLTAATYGKILGVDDSAALEWREVFVREQQYDHLAAIHYMNLMGSVARAVNEGEAYWRW